MGYEYKVVKSNDLWYGGGFDVDKAEEMIYRQTSEGWRLAQTITRDGWTVGFIFERNH